RERFGRAVDALGVDASKAREEARKARERAVRLAKDLEDERKLRQRSELEGQIQRRAPEFPREVEEAKAARERATQLEKELEVVRAERATAAKRLAGLERELDEAQAAEHDLRAQFDVEEAARKSAGDEAEFIKMERELHARGEDVLRLERQLSERDGAIRELAFSLEDLQTRDVAGELAVARARNAELGSLNTGLAAEAQGIVELNDLLRERVTKLETDLDAKVRELDAARRVDPGVENSLRARAEAAEKQSAAAIEATRVADRSATVAREALHAQEQLASKHAAGLAAASQQLEAARVETSRLLGSVRGELAAQHALAVSLEDRRSKTEVEFEGARAGYQRRVRELEREVESLVQALEVVGTHASDEDERFGTLAREFDTLRAERNGVAFRLGDAEVALAARAKPAIPADAVTTLREDASDAMVNDQLLEDLAETAARLASTEESLVATREAALAAERRGEEIASELASARAELHALAGSAAMGRPGGDVERESAERELLVRSLVAQLED
ncbi:MAG: hypothetical protein WCJ30_29040, partial [Deltaproteobacteria bacterium]